MHFSPLPCFLRQALDTAPIEQLLIARARAKQARDFGKADALRGEYRAAATLQRRDRSSAPQTHGRE